MDVTSNQAWHSVKNILNNDRELFLYLFLYLLLSVAPVPLIFLNFTSLFENETSSLGLALLFTSIIYLSFLYICFKHAIAFTTLERLQNRNATPASTFAFIFKHLNFILKLTVLVTIYQLIKLGLRILIKDKNRVESIALALILGISDVFTSAFMSLLIPTAILEKDYSLKSLKNKTKKISNLFDGRFGWGPFLWVSLAYLLVMVILLMIISESYHNQFYTGFVFLSMIYGLLTINQLMNLSMSIYMSHLAFGAFKNPQNKYHLKK